MNIGVMGGTFDPIHLGHLGVAEEARGQLNLAEVIFVPAGHPYFKSKALITPAELRVAMLNLAIEDKPYFKISLLEIKRSGPSYAVETLARMKRQLKAEDEIFFILGWDSLLTLPRWQEPERLIRLCRIIAAPRAGYPKPDINLVGKELPGLSQRAVVMDRPLIDISATEIRERVLQGLSIDALVPLAVSRYIQEKGLYRGKL